MEKTGTACVGVDDTATLTWIEYKLETFATIIKERLSKIVEAKETVSDWDKAAWFTSIVVLLGKVLPANRFLFRIIEEENQFLIQLHDPAQMQQPQEIEVPYRKVFDWGVKSWEDASMLCKKDRLALYAKWKEAGMSSRLIAEHFNIRESSVNSWSKHGLRSEGSYRSTIATIYEKSHTAIINGVMMILKKAGATGFCFTKVFQHAYECKTGRTVAAGSVHMAKSGIFVSSDTDMCLDIAILYVEGVIFNIKKMNELTHSNQSVAGALRNLRRITGFSLLGKQEWVCGKGSRQLINHEGLEKCLVFYNNVLNNLNQMKGEK